MKIDFNPQIRDYLNRCLLNSQNNPYNDFLNVDLKLNDLDEVLSALKEVNYPEFKGNQKNWPSLYLSSSQFINSEYHKTIKFVEIHEEDVKFENIELLAHQLFNYKEIQADPNKEMNDWMVLRALDENLSTLSLSIMDEVWMLDVPSESSTIDPIAQKANGKVITFGLGIGYFIFMAALNPQVQSITVVEKNKRIIELFKKYLLPQFNLKIELNIIEGNAFDYFNEETLSEYDCIFVDIYQSSDDGLEMEMKLLENFNPDFDKCDFWIEGSNLEVMPMLMYLYVDSILHQHKLSHPDPLFNLIVKKIQKVLDADKRYIHEVNDLKELFYDKKLHRLILSTNVK